jgi:hypothetical protein
MLASGIHDRTVAVWEGDVSVDSWQRRACSLANRNLTQAEWDQYIGRDLPFQDTCPQPPRDQQQTASAPSPASATQPTTTSHNPPTNSGARPSAAFPNPTERQLLRHVPSAMRAGCDRAPQPLTGAIAAVRCTANHRLWVQYNLFRSTAVMTRWFSSRVKQAGAHVGSCRQSGTRPHVDKVLRDRQQVGDILCYKRRGEARLEWTHKPLGIYAVAFSRRLTTHRLYHDILEHAGPLS